ncbi:Dabb family protein [Microbacterium sp. EYE_5]|uniref:Dabb family protein n=1 Tax=unclassified Microbacterium TaxID=2609290 RepID=UPI0020056D6D|nr:MULTISPECIES: Dabb family protein [unclassified Microbacterium]MCK6081256.1 Dabb family protein [Microbacterium sp. EYE_382]MCK6086526.1 Dabb family protein [Microbacterium sp. EYE_384]MCK6123976.1 Dabb family protein [Microbacterium sp. EYE_80]MCK6126885.1 Dabb family protein [Microbacterium sp. EYE_79]MCK6142211.1 Dabb family protein [Microbacterium sp. EYE_39]
MTIQHTVVFALHHDEGSAEESEFLAEAQRVLPAVPGVQQFRVNKQVSPQSDLRWQFTMLFDDQAAYDAYNEHPDHVAFVQGRWQNEVRAFQEYDFVAGD